MAAVQAIKSTNGDHTASAIPHIIYPVEYLQLLLNSSIVVASEIWYDPTLVLVKAVK